MKRDDHQDAQPEVAPRQPYEPPRLQVVELLPEETLGIGCKTEVEVPCSTNFNYGS